ncbi:GTP-binding protein Rit1 isoform X2 [Pituophis catenifer annectens]|uniref:GTP-binding protein Rit1 isoform X2 n=1 Tax=Pituophis catenifer annectens TaxID=94852 RepID=UPI003993C928
MEPTGPRGPVVGIVSGPPAGQPREYKLVMLGAGGVGKSAMTMQFISHRFPEDHDPTIEDAYKMRIRIDDEPANLDILDTAGQAEFTAMRDQYMRAGEGFIICYSITDRRSFHEVREFKQLIYRVRRTDETPVVLVGNKSDLTQLRQDGCPVPSFNEKTTAFSSSSFHDPIIPCGMESGQLNGVADDRPTT